MSSSHIKVPLKLSSFIHVDPFDAWLFFFFFNFYYRSNLFFNNPSILSLSLSLPISLEQIPKKVCRIKSESSKCYLLLYWSSSFHGHHCISSTQLHCSIHNLFIKHLATQPFPTSNCWHTHHRVVIQLRIVL